MKERFSEEQIIGFRRDADKGVAVKGCTASTGYPRRAITSWRSKYRGVNVSDAKRLKAPPIQG